MTLIELQEIFGERIKVALDDSLSLEEKQAEAEQSKLIMGIGKQMINNGDLILRTEQALSANKISKDSEISKLIKGK